MKNSLPLQQKRSQNILLKMSTRKTVRKNEEEKEKLSHLLLKFADGAA
ncbi:Uncharacterised protein [Mycobacteroides abscessus subsp. abscessus]|nr:Uncharacterised protein [Mycobacteroides abscessus subsp. abscessus]